MKAIIKNVGLALVTLLVTAVLGEAMLRIKNSDQKNYIIETWRYAKELRKISPNAKYGHVQVPHSAAELQNVKIAINGLGMRGPEPDLTAGGVERILLLGSSITLGWGVPEEQTIRAVLENKLGAGYRVLNGGVVDYNTARSIAYFKEAWRKTAKPDVVVVHYFLNDVEYLPPSTSNAMLRSSQLAVTLYYLARGLTAPPYSQAALISHYRDAYQTDRPGFVQMMDALRELKKMSDEDGFKVVFTMIPDIHRLDSYPFRSIHQTMRKIAEGFGWKFVDFLDVVGGFKGPELWTIPGDPHPNGLVHGLMANYLVPHLK